MPEFILHYGTGSFRIANMRAVTDEMDEAIASGGGWIEATTVDGRQVALLISLGVPIWVEEVGEGAAGGEVGPERSRIIV